MNEILTSVLLFFLGGVAGFVNVMAGGGSSIVLPALIFIGLDPALANGTNRVALLFQNASAVISFRRSAYADFGLSFKMALFTLPGAVLGAFYAVKIDDAVFQRILGVVILGVVVGLLLPKRKTAPIVQAFSKKRALWIYPAMFAIGFYGGFIQIGVGFLLMFSLRYLMSLDLVRVNMHKVFIVFVYTFPALAVFALTGNVNLRYGVTLGLGNALGAWWSAKLAVSRGERFVRYVLTFALILMAIQLFRNQ